MEDCLVLDSGGRISTSVREMGLQPPAIFGIQPGERLLMMQAKFWTNMGKQWQKRISELARL